MPNTLKIFIITFILLFLFYVIKNVKNNKLNIQNALIWLIMSIGIIICIFQIDNLEKLSKLIGAKTLSNIIFFLGFIFLLYVCFNITKTISTHNKKIINLTQELAILRKEIEDEKKR